jgi:hypothetical protein
MAKCGVVDCTEGVIGGFERSINAGNFENPTATIPGMRTLWCEDHESALNKGLGQGRYLSAEDLRDKTVGDEDEVEDEPVGDEADDEDEDEVEDEPVADEAEKK